MLSISSANFLSFFCSYKICSYRDSVFVSIFDQNYFICSRSSRQRIFFILYKAPFAFSFLCSSRYSYSSSLIWLLIMFVSFSSATTSIFYYFFSKNINYWKFFLCLLTLEYFPSSSSVLSLSPSSRSHFSISLLKLIISLFIFF